MGVVAFDTETCLIRPAQLAPPLVCVTWARPGLDARIVHHTDAEEKIHGWLTMGDLIVGHNVAYDMAVIAQRFPRLVPLIFKAYDEDRVTCTKIRAQLLDIASGAFRRKHVGRGVFIKQTYDLETLARRFAGMELKKDAWRMSYSNFLDVPISKWPDRARAVQAEARARLAALASMIAAGMIDPEADKTLKKEIDGLREMVDGPTDRVTDYPLDDARATLAVYLAQEKHSAWLADQYRQARAYFWLHLSSAWGLRTDEVGVEVLRKETTAAIEELEEELMQLGIVRADGSRDTKLAKARMLEVCRRDAITIPRTATHGEPGKCKRLDGTALPDGSDECEEHVCLDADACEASEDDVLIGYADYSQQRKVLTNDVAALLKGIHWPVHTSYGLADTGRTTSAKPNIQNVTKRPGMRECYVARPGKLFAQCDYPTLELYTLAQCCVERVRMSKLAEALNAGLDPHLWFAAKMLGISYEDASKNKKRADVKRARQLAKAADFGFPGGMGVKKFVSATRKGTMAAAKAEGLDPKEAWAELGLDEARAKKLKEEWFAAFPEMPYWFSLASNAATTEDGKGSVESLGTQRHRGQATYCARSNTPFQGLAADCAKRAGWLIARAQYTESTSPLFNTRTVAFVHDEFIIEVPDDVDASNAAAHELARLMMIGANVFLPNVPIPASKMEPLLMRRWSKNAAPRVDAQGRLVAWE